MSPGLRRRCPVCGAGYARPAWHEAGERYVRCSACTTLFSDIDAAHYAAVQHNAWHDERLDAGTLAFYGDARELVHGHFLAAQTPRLGARLLDVGCGLGFFLKRALEAGWDAYGCDTSPAWVAHAGDRIGPGRVSVGDVDTAPPAGVAYDLITAWDVLEHVFDPVPFLTAIVARLAPGGRVFIRTPNEAWVYPTYAARRRVGEAVELGPLNHVVYYRAATLVRLFDLVGLRATAWPSLVPPQVGLGNRPSLAGPSSRVTMMKNLHAAAARGIAAASRGRLVIGSDLDVVAVRASTQ